MARLLEPPPDVHPDVLADVKRFRERWIGDDRFRAGVPADPDAACRALGLALDPRPLAFLWDRARTPEGLSPELAAYRALDHRGRAYAAFCADDSGADPRFAAWRRRQQARCAFELGAVAAPVNPHLPFAVELTEGCSVGCWFCGLSARPLGRLAAGSAAAIEEWRAILAAFAGVWGPFASRGMLFWATDPLDHPDYETFADAFARALGSYPATTTARPLDDVARTRALIRRLDTDEGPGLRFSILTRHGLDAIHAAFTARELAGVDLVLANRESLHGLAIAGRLHERDGRLVARVDRERRKLRDAALDPEAETLAVHETIACVSGFLIELPARRVRLVTPVRASDRWPDGYAVLYDEGFADAAELESRLHAAMTERMAERPAPDAELCLPPELDVEAEGHGLAVRGRGHEVVFSRRSGLGVLPDLAARFRDIARIGEVVEAVRPGPGREAAYADAVTLWRHGVLVEREMVEPS